MKPSRIIPHLAAAVIAASAAQAAVINVPDYTLVPDGSTFGSDNSNTSTQLQITDVQTPNGGVVLPAGGTSTAYVVTTFTWGAGSNVHMFAHFAISNGANRLGVAADDDGIFISFGDGNNNFATAGGNGINLAQDMAGQTVTILLEFLYDVNRNTLNSDDTLMNVWINPTVSSTASGGSAGGDFNVVWNSSAFTRFEQRIENQGTPGTSGASSITNTTILTGTDATWSNALAIAIPEPSAVLLGSLGILALLRRRRNA